MTGYTFCIGIIVSLDNNIMWMIANQKECIAVDATDPEALEKAISVDFENIAQLRQNYIKKSNQSNKQIGNTSDIPMKPMLLTKDQIMVMKKGCPRKLLAVLTTHHHSDHSKGDKFWRSQDLEVYDFTKVEQIYNRQKINRVDQDDGAFDVSFEIKDFLINVLFTPCHTLDSMCFLIDKKWLFTGDTLFYLGCGRFFEGKAEDMQKNFDKIIKLDNDVICCYGHDYSKDDLMFVKKYCDSIYDKLDFKDNNSLKKTGKGLHYNLLTINEEKRFNPFINAKQYGKTLDEMRTEKNSLRILDL